MNAYLKRQKAQAARAVVGIDAAKRVHTAVVRTADGLTACRSTSPPPARASSTCSRNSSVLLRATDR